MRLRTKITVVVCAALMSIGMVATPASAIRGCDTPGDNSCCSIIQALKGCQN